MQTARRRFLLGKTDAPPPLRPPRALAEDSFVARCTRCDGCVRACPTGIVVRGAGGFPELDFHRGECTFCGDCVEVCAPGALGAGAWTVRAEIGANCLTRGDVACRSCGDACAVRAIRFVPRRGGIAAPQLDAAACTGCGACCAPCPVDAVTLRAACDVESAA